MDILDQIIEKIDNKTVTVEDFNRLIKESTPDGVQERIRRRTQVNATKSHIALQTWLLELTLNVSPRINKTMAEVNSVVNTALKPSKLCMKTKKSQKPKKMKSILTELKNYQN